MHQEAHMSKFQSKLLFWFLLAAFLITAASGHATRPVLAGSGPVVRDHREKGPSWKPKADSKPIVRDHRGEWKPKPTPKPKWPHYPSN
jgi:hypothetical protein